MAPTPIDVNGVLRLSFDVAGLPHIMDFYVEIDGPGVLNQVRQNLPLTGTDSPATVAQRFWDDVRVVYPASVAAANYTLLWRDDNVLIPVDGGGLTGVGTDGGTIKLATQLTLTFKDQTQHLVRMQFPETTLAVPSKDPAASATGAVAAIIADFVATPDGTKASSWARSRTGLQLDRALFSSTDTNDKYRRARGL